MVLFNHTGTDGFMLFTVARSSGFYFLYLFFSILIKIAVPLFFMTSGALLLGKEESYGVLLKKRFLKYGTLLFIGSFIAYLYACFRTAPQEVNLPCFFKTLYTDRVSVAYWYLYAYLSYILMLPILRKMVRAMTNHEFKWMFLMYAFIQTLSLVEFLIWKDDTAHNSYFFLFITKNYIFYPAMGYYIDQRMEKSQFTKKSVLILAGISVAAVCVCSVMTHYRCTLLNEWQGKACQKFFNTLIFLPTITVFYAVKMWFMNHKPGERTCRLITAAGGTTFGIYLIEQICRNETKPVFLLLKPYIRTLPACCIWILAACLGGGIFIWLLKKIPGVKKWI